MGLTRRQLVLAGLGGLAAVAQSAASPLQTRAASTARNCTLYPRQTEGPFFVDLGLVRRDITEGSTGAPLTLVLHVTSDGDCGPVAGVAVEVWHADAGGDYSGMTSDTRGETFLRGAQITDSNGRVEFRTIYPGWYPGRTTHVHFKVVLSERLEVSSQLYFPEEVTRAVYETPPYLRRGRKDVSNAADALFRSGGRGMPLLAIEPIGSGYRGGLTVTVAA